MSIVSIKGEKKYTVATIKGKIETPQPGPPREILQGRTRLHWVPGDTLKLFSILRI
jgi:hypothetical protein